MKSTASLPRVAPCRRLDRRFTFIALSAWVALAALAGCSVPRIDQAPRVATGLASQLVCGGTFVADLPPERTYEELVLTTPGIGLAAWALDYQVDRAARSVEARFAGGFASRSEYREGRGCVIVPEAGAPASAATATGSLDDSAAARRSPEPAPLPVDPPDPALEAALAKAFDEPGQRVRAIVVLHDGHVVAERYAAGITADTPLLGFSMTKSVTSALAGVLVRQGRLRVDEPVAVAGWQHDGRRAITVDQLLRQVSGLDLPQLNSGFDVTSRIMFTAPDKAAACSEAPLAHAPGTRWNYTDCHYMLLSRALVQAAGGQTEDLLRTARSELFEPAGLRHATWDVDASGTPNGAMALHASARDWARLGQLYLDDGVAGGRRLLPEGWVRYSTTPTGDAGYGAGWWLQHDGEVPDWHLPWGLPHAPAGTFLARGYRGQFTIVVPSARLVVVRLAASDMTFRHIASTDDLVAALVERFAR